MSFFQSVQQRTVQLSALITFLIGLAILCYGLYIVGLVLFKNYEGFFVFDSEIGMFGQKYGALILGVFLVLIGCCGLLGSTSDRVSCKRTFLAIYQFSLLLLIIIFGLIYYGLAIQAKNYFEKECEATPIFKELSDGVKSANNAFCAVPCPCNMNPSKFANKAVLVGRVGFQSTTLPSRVQECVVFDNEKYKYPAQMMDILERQFSCSGWCSSTSIFVFSDVNRGNTDGTSCFRRFQEYYRQYVSVCGYISLGLSILFFISFIFICGLYCYFSKKQKKRVQNRELNLLLRQ